MRNSNQVLRISTDLRLLSRENVMLSHSHLVNSCGLRHRFEGSRLAKKVFTPPKKSERCNAGNTHLRCVEIHGCRRLWYCIRLSIRGVTEGERLDFSWFSRLWFATFWNVRESYARVEVRRRLTMLVVGTSGGASLGSQTFGNPQPKANLHKDRD